jgi:hypothetical protein
VSGVDDPIEAYLDELLVHLRGSPRTVRRVLAEAEAHLRDAVDNGATPQEAIARFGDARVVATRCNGVGSVPLPVLARQLLLAATLLCSIGFLAIGASGVVSAALDVAFGPRVVAGDLPDVRYTPARCAELHALAPHEPTCLAAAARHHADEVERYRIAAGVLGAAGLGAWALLRRRWRATPATGALPPGMVPAVGAAVFGVATLALASQAMQSIGWRSTAGLGQWVSAAGVSAVVAAGFGVVLYRTLRRPSPSLSTE